MAEIEEAAGDDGAVREWLDRATRARRDRAWVAEGIVADRWTPAAPNGTLDAFVWRTPIERTAEPVAPIVIQSPPAPPVPAKGAPEPRAASGAPPGAPPRRFADGRDRQRARRSRAESGSADEFPRLALE